MCLRSACLLGGGRWGAVFGKRHMSEHVKRFRESKSRMVEELSKQLLEPGVSEGKRVCLDKSLKIEKYLMKAKEAKKGRRQ